MDQRTGHRRPRPKWNLTGRLRMERPACWDEISKIEFKPLESLGGDLTDIEDAKEEGRDGRRSQRMLTDLESQIRVTDLGGTFWTQVLKWAGGQQDLSPGDLQLLGLAASIPKRLPNSKQSKRLLEIESKYAENVGDANVVVS